ncbi:hypothetical protein BJV77DRAFT_908163, partial [Russula vinacea]
VNNLLHTLRGEHFRRTLNSQRTRLGTTALSTSQSVGRSLPYAEIYGPQLHRLSSQALGVDVKDTGITAAGPIPRSWAAAATASAKGISEGPAWRATALSLFFAQSDDDPASITETAHGRQATTTPCPRPCPSLAECCLRVLLEHCCPDSDSDDVDTLEELASYLAPHHRKQAVRMCAVRNPLSGAGLRVLLGEGWNHVEGELVLVGNASLLLLRPELFRTSARAREVGRPHQRGLGREWTEGERGWGESGSEDQEALTAVAIVSATLSIPVLLALPASLTRLALVHLSAPIPVHRLPDKCPLLEFLDISYNPWLAEPAWGGEQALDRVAWGRWAYLKVLGCRDCGVISEELRRVNEGRWEDVVI